MLGVAIESRGNGNETSLLARLNYFAVLWAMSTLFQLFALGSVIRSLAAGTPQGVVELALAFSAAAVIWRPGLRALIIMSSLQILDALIVLPQLPNNRLLSCFVNITLLLAAVRHLGQKAANRNAHIFFDFSQSVRVEVLGFYFFAVFAKLNTGFLSASTSCASTFYSRMAAWFPLAPLSPWAVESIIYVTIACEFLIPVLLYFQRSRNLGIGLGFFFHFALSVDYFQHTMDFSSLLFALLFLFTPQNSLEAIRTRFFARLDEEELALLMLRLRLILVVSAAFILIAGLTPGELGEQSFFYGKHVLWYTFAAAIGAVYFSLIGRVRELVPLHAPFKVSGLLMTIPIALVLINGCGPYVGFKTRSSFDMYSNLRMERPNPNHLIVPNSLDLFGLQSDRVSILQSNDPWLADARRRGFEITYFEFAKHVHVTPGIEVEYLRNGKPQAVHTEEERLALEIPPLLARKFLWFRSIDLEPLVRCDW